MLRKHVPGIVLLLAIAVALPTASSRAVAEDHMLMLRAWAVNLNNGARTNSMDIVIDRWSTPEEIEKFRGILIEKGGGSSLVSALQKVKPRCGYVRTSNSLGWDIGFARETVLEDGARKIVVGTDRPISMWEARNNPRLSDYEFSLAEIHMPKDGGKGQGKAISAAKLSFNKEKNTLEIENYQREPTRLNEITIVK